MASIVDIARKELGLTEKPNNSGFKDFGTLKGEQIEKEMKEVGWDDGFSWCALIAERWAKKAYPERVGELNKLFNASAVVTFRNFKKAGYKVSNTPVVGSLVIWQKFVTGKPSWQGHAGIVSEVISDKEFKSIEGNGSVKGSREGTSVVEQTRKVLKHDTGLNVMGFIILS